MKKQTIIGLFLICGLLWPTGLMAQEKGLEEPVSAANSPIDDPMKAQASERGVNVLTYKIEVNDTENAFAIRDIINAFFEATKGEIVFFDELKIRLYNLVPDFFPGIKRDGSKLEAVYRNPEMVRSSSVLSSEAFKDYLQKNNFFSTLWFVNVVQQDKTFPGFGRCLLNKRRNTWEITGWFRPWNDLEGMEKGSDNRFLEKPEEFMFSSTNAKWKSGDGKWTGNSDILLWGNNDLPEQVSVTLEYETDDGESDVGSGSKNDLGSNGIVVEVLRTNDYSTTLECTAEE